MSVKWFCRSRAAQNTADAICDLVSTGATLEANGLREVELSTALKPAMSIQRTTVRWLGQAELIDKLLTGIQGRNSGARIEIHHDAPSERGRGLSPCCRAPKGRHNSALAGEQRVAMHMVSSETLFLETMERHKRSAWRQLDSGTAVEMME